MHLADHISSFVGCRAVHAKRHGAAQARHRVRRRDTGAEPAVGLWTMRHAGAGARQNLHLIGIEMDKMREPHIRSKPIVVGQPFDRPLAMNRQAKLDILHAFRKMAVQPQLHPARGRDRFL